jgi:hypothetical protein
VLFDRQLVQVTIKQRFANPVDLQHLIDRAECAIGVAVSDDGLGFGFADARQFAAEGFRIGRIEIDLVEVD